MSTLLLCKHGNASYMRCKLCEQEGVFFAFSKPEEFKFGEATTQYDCELLENKVAQLKEVAKAMRTWIDAVPANTYLPAMPGFDRDWADSIIDGE